MRVPLNDFLNRIWNLRPGELSLILVLGFALLSNSLAQKVSEIASISNFLSDVGVPQFLIVLIISSGVSILMTSLQSLLVDRFDRITLIRGISISLGLAFILLRLLFFFGAPAWLNYSIFYLLSDQQFTFFPLAFWILSNDILDVSQTKRLFPILASWGFAGNLVGIGIAAISPKLFSLLGLQSEALLTLNILIYLMLYLLFQFGLKHIRMRQTRHTVETIQETLTEGWEFIREVPAFRYLTISILAIIVCENIIDFHFFVVSESAFNSVETYQIFFSLFTLARVLAYITIQAVLTQRIISAINLKNTFLIQPFSSLAGAICSIAMPGLWGSVGGVALQKLPQYSIDETARKAFQGFVPEERRGRVSLFMDSYLVAGGAILSAALTGTIILLGEQLQIYHYAYIYLAVAVLAAFAGIWAILRMHTVYDSSLFNWRLKRRQRGKSILDKLDF
jgi:ATP:ADP antiporter, AAA family